jgi:hypothetical protein
MQQSWLLHEKICDTIMTATWQNMWHTHDCNMTKYVTQSWTLHGNTCDTVMTAMWQYMLHSIKWCMTKYVSHDRYMTINVTQSWPLQKNIYDPYVDAAVVPAAWQYLWHSHDWCMTMPMSHSQLLYYSYNCHIQEVYLHISRDAWVPLRHWYASLDSLLACCWSGSWLLESLCPIPETDTTIYVIFTIY